MIKIKNTLSHIEYFILIIAFLSCLINYFYRTGLDNDIFLIIKAFILSSLMILLPSFIIKQDNKLYLKPILLFFIFIFIIFLSIFKIIINLDISFALYLTGFIILIISLVNIRFI